MTGAAEQRYRRVSGQLAWAVLYRADLSFPISFLSRFQAKPNPAAEHCVRTFLISEVVGVALTFCSEDASSSVSICR